MSGCDCVRCQTEECDNSELCGCCLNAEVERLTTAIQRVREVCANPETTWRPGEGLGLVRVESILRALDGDSNE